MSDYKSGKGYRETLRARPRQTSTPDAREVDPVLGGFPVHHRGGIAHHHKETVGHLPGGGYADATHPNADAKRHGNSGTREEQTPHAVLDRVKMKPES
jgi:hypothetical protein